MDDVPARRLWRTLEPIHACIYFAAEAGEEYEAIGLKGGRMGYFASRSAAMGPVPAEVVIATFFNFHPDVVRRAIPDAWSRASPAEVLAARYRAADRVLRRLLGDETVGSAGLAEAAGLARTAAEACLPQGRPLFAGHASLDWPEDPHVVLWHAVTLLREHRGDGHVAALVTDGVDPCSALVLHGASGGFPLPLLRSSRAWPDDVWAAAEDRLRSDGLLSADGTLTADGVARRQRVEDLTDRLAAAPYRTLGQDGCQRLIELVRPLGQGIVESGAFPVRLR
jgi:hypothetical protein